MNVDPNMISDAMVGGGVVAAVLALGFLALVIFVALYVYVAMAWMTIARKLKNKNAWMAWFPILNIVPILQLGGFHWAWIFLILIPVVGWIALWILAIISTWRIFEKRKYPGWFSLSMIIPKVGLILYLIAIGFVAWKDKNNAAKGGARVKMAAKKKAKKKTAKKATKKKTAKKKKK